MPRESVRGAAAVLPWMVLAAGLVLAALAVALGINRARRASAQEELDRIFTLSSDLIAVADFRGFFTRVNPAAERILGYAGDELRARPYLDFVHPEDREKTAAEAAALGQGRATLSSENRYVRNDGSLRVLEWKTTPIVEDGFMYAVFPSPVASRMEREPSGFPLSFEPRRPEPDNARQGRDRPTEHGLKQRSTTSAEPPIQRVYSWCTTSRRTA